MPHRIAVIGAGVSGLSATWALNEHPPQAGAEVHLFEPGEYIGGHTHTVRFVPPKNANGQLEETDVDT